MNARYNQNLAYVHIHASVQDTDRRCAPYTYEDTNLLRTPRYCLQSYMTTANTPPSSPQVRASTPATNTHEATVHCCGSRSCSRPATREPSSAAAVAIPRARRQVLHKMTGSHSVLALGRCGHAFTSSVKSLFNRIHNTIPRVDQGTFESKGD